MSHISYRCIRSLSLDGILGHCFSKIDKDNIGITTRLAN